MTANFLLSTKEMWDRRKPGHDERMMRMLSDEFLAAAMGFPRDWIRSVLVAEKPWPAPVCEKLLFLESGFGTRARSESRS